MSPFRYSWICWKTRSLSSCPQRLLHNIKNRAATEMSARLVFIVFTLGESSFDLLPIGLYSGLPHRARFRFVATGFLAVFSAFSSSTTTCAMAALSRFSPSGVFAFRPTQSQCSPSNSAT
jgi:hypothetical protein